MAREFAATALIVLSLTLVACADPAADPTCMCRGAVPEGQLTVACGQSQCVGGTGYHCTGANQAEPDPTACGMPVPLPDAGRLDANRVDAGRADAGVEPTGDGGRPRPDDAGPSPIVDAAVDTCVLQTYYRDSDGDGYGGEAEQRCDSASGYVEQGGDCDDERRDINPDSVEVCDNLDHDCDGSATNGGCTAVEGTFAGTYRLYTDESLGSTIINQMECTGTSTVTIDLSADPVVQGSASCSYSGGLALFDDAQDATIEGVLLVDGSLRLTVDHQYGTFNSERLTRTLEGSVAGAELDASVDSSWRPHPRSAVPWGLEMSLSATRQ